MAVVQTTFNRNEKKGKFTQIDNHIIHDTSISPGARLVLIHMLSKPDDWTFYVEVISKELGISKNTASKYINELILAGYVCRAMVRENGRFNGYQYIINERPTHTDQDGETEQETEPGNDIVTVSQNTGDGDLSATNTDKTNTPVKERKDVKETSMPSGHMNYTFVPSNVPDAFVDVTKPFFDAETIYKLWGKVLLASKNMHVVEPSMDTVISAVKQTIFLYRNRKLKKDLFGYFYMTLCGMIALSERQQSSIPNWLEE